jgi:hypothetical protein
LPISNHFTGEKIPIKVDIYNGIGGTTSAGKGIFNFEVYFDPKPASFQDIGVMFSTEVINNKEIPVMDTYFAPLHAVKMFRGSHIDITYPDEVTLPDT